MIISIIIWLAIGIVAGLVATMMLGTRRVIIFNVIVGAVAALVGGWATAEIAGDAYQAQLIVTSLVALLVCGVALYVFNVMMMHNWRN